MLKIRLQNIRVQKQLKMRLLRTKLSLKYYLHKQVCDM